MFIDVVSQSKADPVVYFFEPSSRVVRSLSPGNHYFRPSNFVSLVISHLPSWLSCVIMVLSPP